MPRQPAWTRIQRTSQVLDPHFEPVRTASGSLRIQAEVTIRPAPTSDWLNLFFQAQSGDLGVLPHAVWDDKITLHLATTDETIEQDISRLDAAINTANREYERLVLPAEHAAASAATAAKEHLDEVANKLASIPPTAETSARPKRREPFPRRP